MLDVWCNYFVSTFYDCFNFVVKIGFPISSYILLKITRVRNSLITAGIGRQRASDEGICS